MQLIIIRLITSIIRVLLESSHQKKGNFIEARKSLRICLYDKLSKKLQTKSTRGSATRIKDRNSF